MARKVARDKRQKNCRGERVRGVSMNIAGEETTVSLSTSAPLSKVVT